MCLAMSTENRVHSTLIENNSDEVMINFYEKNSVGIFTDNKLRLYRKYKDQFIPFLKNICNTDSISYSIKLNAANTLFYIDVKETLQNVCSEILKNIPDPELRTTDHSKYTQTERSNWHLLRRARYKLKMCDEK
jgi:hypothetical protein